MGIPAPLSSSTTLFVYLSNGRTIGAGDTLPAACLPWSLLLHGSFYLDDFPAHYDEGARQIFPLLDGIPYYTLILDLVSEGVSWFGDRGQTPVRLPVRVLPLDIARMLSEPIGAEAPAPVATIATDRPSYRGEAALRLDVALQYPYHPRRFDAYLILGHPDGRALFFDGHSAPRPAVAAWPKLVSGLPLPARVSGRFELPLSMLPHGAYRWHVVLTDPGAYRAVARGEAIFKIEP